MAADDTILDIPTTAKASEVLTHVLRLKGGWKTLPFIIANEILEKVASMGLVPICIPYLSKEYFLGVGGVSTFVLVSGAAANLTPVFGAMVSNFYGKFRVIAAGTTITLAGMLILWSTSVVHALRPSHVCDDSMHCPMGAKSWRLILLFSSFAIMAIGAGGIRPCSPSFGADQIHNPRDPNNRRTIEAYYGWYYSSVAISIMVSVLALSEFQEHVGWLTLFSIPPLLMSLSLAFFMMGSSRYVKVSTKKKSDSGSSMWRVIIGAWKRRRLSLPLPSDDHARWSYPVGSTFVRPTKGLSILNRACLMIEGEEARNPATCLSTVREVEELKALISAIPIWSTGIIITVANTPGAFPNYQARAMDRHIGQLNLTPPAYIIFSVSTMTLWVTLYNKFIIPLIARLTSNRLPNGIPPRIRMAMGLALSCIANVFAGFVEHHRRVVPTGTMSGNWLIPQFSLMGLAEAFYMLGQLDFFNSRFPEGMMSLGNALLSLGQCFGLLTGTLILGQVKRCTHWVKDDLNLARFDYYYWLVAGLSFSNFCYFLVCSWAYGTNRRCTSWDEEPEENAVKKEDIPQLLVGWANGAMDCRLV